MPALLCVMLVWQCLLRTCDRSLLLLAAHSFTSQACFSANINGVACAEPLRLFLPCCYAACDELIDDFLADLCKNAWSSPTRFWRIARDALRSRLSRHAGSPLVKAKSHDFWESPRTLRQKVSPFSGELSACAHSGQDERATGNGRVCSEL